MGQVIQFEEHAVANLRDRLGEAETARANLAAFARGHSGAVATIHLALIAALEADDFDSLAATVTVEWPSLLGIDRVALALIIGDQGFRIDADGVSRCEPLLIERALHQIGEVALRTVEHGHPLFGTAAKAIRAEALVTLEAQAPYPRGLLLLGQGQIAGESSDHGSSLLRFLGRSLGAMLRRWAMND